MIESKDLYCIDINVYKHLRNLCLEYWENKLKVKHILESGGNKPEGTSRATGVYSDPTANKAIKLIEPEKFCEIIETLVKKICADYDDVADNRGLLLLSDFLLLNVTTFNKFNSWRGLKERGYKLVVGRDIFYMLRRKFFFELNEYFKKMRGDYEKD